MDLFGDPSICECDKSYDVGEHLDHANWKFRKTLIDKLVLECKDEILNTTDTISIADKKITCKNNCLIYTILLANIVFNIASYRFYWLLLLLYKILVKKEYI